MNRRFIYPAMVICMAVVLLIFGRFLPSGNDHQDGEKVEKKPVTWNDDLSISAPEEESAPSAQRDDMGSLELRIMSESGDAPRDLEGKITLTEKDRDNPAVLEYIISSPSMLFENVKPGKYQVLVEIPLPGTENSFLGPAELEITAGQKSRHEVTLPSFP